MIGPENSGFFYFLSLEPLDLLKFFNGLWTSKDRESPVFPFIQYYVYLRPNKITVSCSKHLNGFIDWSHLPEAEVGVVAGLGVEDEALKIEMTITSNHEAAIVSQAQQRNSLTLQCHARIQ